MNQNYNGYNPNYNNPNYNNQNYNNQDYQDDSNKGGGCLSFLIALVILIVTVSVLLQMVGIVDFKELYNKYINKSETKEECKTENKPTMKDTLTSVCLSLNEEGKYTNDDTHISCVDKVCNAFDNDLSYTYDCTSKEYIERPIIKKENIVSISKEDIQTKIDNKESFVLLISSNNSDNEYQETIKKIATDYDLTIYSYDINTLSEEEQKTFKETLKIEETPSILFIETGVEDINNRLIGVKTKDEIINKFKEKAIIKEIQ